MTAKSLIALCAVAAAAFSPSEAANAFGLDEPDLRYHEFHRNDALEDYYSYFYDPRGYYPYYNSGEWGRPIIRRYKGPLPPYYEAWGMNNSRYHHVEWHRQHYGGHWRGDW